MTLHATPLQKVRSLAHTLRASRRLSLSRAWEPGTDDGAVRQHENVYLQAQSAHPRMF